MRGKIDSQIMEATLRGQDDVAARIPYFREAQIPRRGTIWMLTSNGVTLTDDLRNRALPVQLRKQPIGYEFHEYEEGTLLKHINQNSAYYLSCVFAIVRKWVEAGRPRTTIKGHDFFEWTQPFDWIITKLFNLPSLLEGVEAQLDRMVSGPKSKARTICQAVDKAKCVNTHLSMMEITNILLATSVSLPNRWAKSSAAELQGLISAEVFSLLLQEKDVPVRVDDYEITKTIASVDGKKKNKYFIKKF
jgi:hypothetical protein